MRLGYVIALFAIGCASKPGEAPRAEPPPLVIAPIVDAGPPVADAGPRVRRDAQAALPERVLPLPVGRGWVHRELRAGGQSLADERTTYPIGYTSPLREKYTAGPVYREGTIRAPIGALERPVESIAIYVYRVWHMEPAEVFTDCCPDGGSELLLTVTGSRRSEPVLIVVWGSRESESERRKLIVAYAKRVEEWLDEE